MEFIQFVFDFVIHIDRYLGDIIQRYDHWTYLLLFLIIFAETGLVVTPVLPGDSLLFAVGAFAAQGALNVYLAFFLLTVAAIAGDSMNYSIGKYLGQRIMDKYPKLIKRKYIDKTHTFYEKYGGKTIIFARFVPIIRTFAPFVAGIGKMNYLNFLFYNVTGGIIWIALFVFGGFFFGNFPIIKKNFTLVIGIIIVLSILPPVIELIKVKLKKR
jgi:membrane-associated protein